MIKKYNVITERGRKYRKFLFDQDNEG